MKKQKETIRRGSVVKSIGVELYEDKYKKLQNYSKSLRLSKRVIIDEALDLWFKAANEYMDAVIERSKNGNKI